MNAERLAEGATGAYRELYDDPGSAVDRPVRWLVGYASARLGVGERASVDVDVATRLLAHWADGWTYEPGAYTLRVGTSVVDLEHDVTVELTS